MYSMSSVHGDEFSGARRGVKRFGPTLDIGALAKRASLGDASVQVTSRLAHRGQRSLGSGLPPSDVQRQLDKYTYDLDTLNPDTFMPMESSANVNPRIIVNRLALNLTAEVMRNPHLIMPISQDVSFIVRDTADSGGASRSSGTGMLGYGAGGGGRQLTDPAQMLGGGPTTEAVFTADAAALNAIMLQQQIEWYKTDIVAYATIGAANIWFGFEGRGGLPDHPGFSLDGVVRYRDTSDTRRVSGVATTVAKFGQTDATNVWPTNGLSTGARVLFVLTSCTYEMMKSDRNAQGVASRTVTYNLRSYRMDDDHRMTTTPITVAWPDPPSDRTAAKFAAWQLMPLVVPAGSTVESVWHSRKIADDSAPNGALFLTVGTVFSVNRRLQSTRERYGEKIDGWLPRPIQTAINHVDNETLVTLLVDTDDGHYYSHFST